LAIGRAWDTADAVQPSTIILRNPGSGDASQFTQAFQLTYGNDSSGIAAGDLDGDGDIDLVVSRSAFDDPSLPAPIPGAVRVMLNNGNADFSFGSFITAVDNPSAVALGDWDGDGDLDVAIASAGLTAVDNRVFIV